MLAAPSRTILERIQDPLENTASLLSEASCLLSTVSSNDASLEPLADWVYSLHPPPDATWIYADALYHAARLKCALGNPLDGIEALFGALFALDAGIGLTRWITHHPERPGDDDDKVLDSILPRGMIVDAEHASAVASVARIAQALGIVMTKAGNARHGLHMHLCATFAFDRLKFNVSHLSHIPLSISEHRKVFLHAIDDALALSDCTELAVELATRWVTLHEVALVEAVRQAQDEGASVDPSACADPESHILAQEALGRALQAFGDLDGAYAAWLRTIDLLQVEWPFGKVDRELQVDPLLLKSIRSHLTECGRSLHYPNCELLNHARAVIKIARQLEQDQPNKSLDPSESARDARLFLAAGSLAYGYALDLAGGSDDASSPPVAVAVPGTGNVLQAEGVVSIRELLEEAVEYLTVALERALADNDTNFARVVALQLAIVQVERRQEPIAHTLLETHSLSRPFLIDLDNSRKNVQSLSPCIPTIEPFLQTVYSSAALKRLLPLAPSPKLPTKKPSKPRMLLSRRSRVNLRVQCTFCCMSSVSEPIKCEICASSGVLVWYCTEECMMAHAGVHKKDCVISGGWVAGPGMFGYGRV
ncbi:uncharacterized protein SPPG_06916 [Spizellomyces punctatus DAOM BR117]|uniref:Uncharacterized protein n=1 Tax=Spizellomyces punctatus (strain DAOM BR117) TaxID=645134 RepID=A0A0L0HA81_SPIPD|nr:uncharacterized protein SPPG_06916 [Spizellomyces punctatus DAOM BR117]KNC97926.1 hypothetical protein SPPG_06916 [Spizellomyces punctatus DAOM BR117]|eukprot:XP_016605966.1 hypothetical protein SPPG_06916 [Spizellomyces punctatus DAOM BR117]